MNELPSGVTEMDLAVVERGFNKFQELQQKNLVYPQPHDNLMYPLLGLVGEVGELFQKLKKNQRDGTGKITEELVGSLEGELGDIIWYLQAICGELGTNLGLCVVDNLIKIYGRKERGVIHGNGDNR